MHDAKKILIINTFIVGDKASYWDYRDYLFCLVSNLSLRDYPIRLNIEKGAEWVSEFSDTARDYKFSDFKITTGTPPSWAEFMLDQISNIPAIWTMPWPGDHIYISDNPKELLEALDMGERLNADSVAYGHVQDFEFLIDWSRVNILYNDDKYVMIEWGLKFQHLIKSSIQDEIKKTIDRSIKIAPTPGFLVYKTELLKEILEYLGPNTNRWQDMEYSRAPRAMRYKLLIPKAYLYRHVHGYWLEGFFKYQGMTCAFPLDVKSEIDSWYIKSNFDRRLRMPTPQAYKKKCLNQQPYLTRYFHGSKYRVNNNFQSTPFDTDWKRPNKIKKSVINFIDLLLFRPFLRIMITFKKSTIVLLCNMRGRV